jgi:hypothetical protein
MKKYAFLNFTTLVAFVFITTYALFSASGCITPCPEKTCADLSLIAKTLPTQAGDSVVRSLSFQNIGTSYQVEARDSVTGTVLYSQALTTSTTHNFVQPYNFRTVTWTVRAIYCDTPPRELTCTAHSRIKGGGISVVVVDRVAPGGYVCPGLLSLKTFFTNHVSSPNALPATVILYNGSNAISSEQVLLSSIVSQQTTTGANLWLEVVAVNDLGCTATINQVKPAFADGTHQSSRKITTIADLHIVIDSVLRKTSAIGNNYNTIAPNQYYSLRYLQYQ